MRFSGANARMQVKGLFPQAVMYMMLGFVVGFMVFYDTFYYYCVPFNSHLPSWLLVLVIGLTGILACYLYPDIFHVMVTTVMLPLLGAGFCFIMFISPAFSPDIIGAFSDSFFEMARYILFDMILAMIVIFTTGFASLYFFDTE